MATGRFITLEGGEGVGKSTQLQRLAAWLESRGIEVVRTREPGGTTGAEAIRRLLVEGEAGRWDPTTELLLVAAARRDHQQRLIEPALARGTWVLCDRFSDSTRVYQGLAGGIDLAVIDQLHTELLGAREPDLTLVLDLPVEEGLHRRGAQVGQETRFERKGSDFHEAVRQGFRQLADSMPDRLVLVDASGEPGVVEDRIRAVVAARFGLALPGER